MNKLGQLLRVGFLDGVERYRFGAQRFGQPIHHAAGCIRAEGVEQEFSRHLQTAARHVIACRGQVMELVEDQFRVFGGNRRHLGDFLGQLLQIVVGKLRKYGGAGLIAQDNHEHGRLAQAAWFFVRLGSVQNHGKPRRRGLSLLLADPTPQNLDADLGLKLDRFAQVLGQDLGFLGDDRR